MEPNPNPNPNPEPVGRRTRLQQSLRSEQTKKANKQARVEARRVREAQAKAGRLTEYVNSNEQNDGDSEEAVVIDEAEFLERIRHLESVQRVGGSPAAHVVGSGDNKGKKVMKDDVKGFESDDSLQIIGEKWNPLEVFDDQSDDDDDNCENQCHTVRAGIDEVKVGSSISESFSSEEDDDELTDHDFNVLIPDSSSSSELLIPYANSDEEEVRIRKDLDDYDESGGGCRTVIDDEKGKGHASIFEVRRRADDGGGGGRSVIKKKHDKKRKEQAASFEFRRRVDEGLVDSAASPMKKSEENSSKVRKRKYKDKANVSPQELDVTSLKEDHNDVDPTKKNKQQKKKLMVKDDEDALLNMILENGGEAELEDIVSSTSDDQEELPRKFRYGVEKKPELEKSPSEQEAEDLFKELDFGLGVCDIGLESSCVFDNEVEDAILCDSAVSRQKLCSEGKHYLIQDDEIGIKCKFCSFVELEIRDVTPAFNDNPFGKLVNSRYGRLPDDHDCSSERFPIPDSDHDLGAAIADETSGTVWDLIPGVKRTLYEHQQKGFEFIWKNIAGGIIIEELGKPSKLGLGGCIICHAPGTGKTRLAIVFLQSYLKQYPMSKPVIIAPSSMLLTWEEEFARWNVDVPFVNLNSPEFSCKEVEMLKHVKHSKNIMKNIRTGKLCVWAMGKGVLGISYRMFEKLAGERKSADQTIKKALLQQSGLLVLDEGHTPRNEDSYIWKVFSEVHTKKRIILSGTPFQNNFVELNNTLSLIREEFGDPFLRGNFEKSGMKGKPYGRGLIRNCSKEEEDRRIEILRNRLKPFVHVHKGEILKKTLRGLFHSVVVLRPSEVQRKFFRYLAGIKCGLKLDYLVSIASVHPSLLYKCEHVPNVVDDKLLNLYKTDLDVGVKIKFLFELIKLSKGEKVLVFSQFLTPLTFIGDLLKAHFKWTENNEYLFMEGKQRPKHRQSLIKIFNDPDSAARVLLASTKACCEGIHLVGASRVVLLDVVWNPSVERQAISRAYRIGQKKDVFVYHLITSDTQEKEKYFRQVAKDRVSEQVFTSSDGEGGLKASILSMVSEDRILEEMVKHEKLKQIFENIIYQPKSDKLIDNFDPPNV